MSISEMKREIPTMMGEAEEIVKTAKDEKQKKLAERLVWDIKDLTVAIKLLEHGYQPEATTEKIGENMQKIANTVTTLSSKTTTLDVHKRLDVIFGMLKIMKAESTSTNPLVARWLAKGMKKAANAI
jgi:hypothetical protein